MEPEPTSTFSPDLPSVSELPGEGGAWSLAARPRPSYLTTPFLRIVGDWRYTALHDALLWTLRGLLIVACCSVCFADNDLPPPSNFDGSSAGNAPTSAPNAPTGQSGPGFSDPTGHHGGGGQGAGDGIGDGGEGQGAEGAPAVRVRRSSCLQWVTIGVAGIDEVQRKRGILRQSHACALPKACVCVAAISHDRSLVVFVCVCCSLLLLTPHWCLLRPPLASCSAKSRLW